MNQKLLKIIMSKIERGLDQEMKMAKENESEVTKNNNVKNRKRFGSRDENGKGEETVNAKGDGKLKKHLEAENGNKVEKYLSKRGKRKSIEKSRVGLKGEAVEKQIVHDATVEMKGDEILEADESKGSKDVSKENENMPKEIICEDGEQNKISDDQKMCPKKMKICPRKLFAKM